MCFARVENENEVVGLKKLYHELKHQYGTVFDARLIIFGVNKDGPVEGGDAASSSSTEPRLIENKFYHCNFILKNFDLTSNLIPLKQMQDVYPYQ